MALDRTTSGGTRTGPDHPDTVAPRYHEPNTGRSNFTAYVLSGGFLAAGLLGYLYYDMTAPRQLDSLTTGSVTRPKAGPQPIHAPEADQPGVPGRTP